MKRKVIHIYSDLVRKVYNQGYIETNNKTIDSFITYFKFQINEEFIWDYITFQLSYWSNKRTNYSLNASWVFGPKARNRWDNKPINWQYFTQLFLNKYELQRPVNYFKADLEEKFEQERGKYFGTDNGILNCLAASYYSERSKFCKICEFKDICKKI